MTLGSVGRSREANYDRVSMRAFSPLISRSRPASKRSSATAPAGLSPMKTAAGGAPNKSVPLRPIFASYAKEAELAPSHLGDDDVAAISRTDIVAWKDALLDGGMSNVTVRDVYVAAVKATLQYAVDQGTLAENPKIPPPASRSACARRRWSATRASTARKPRRSCRRRCASRRTDQRRDGGGAPVGAWICAYMRLKQGYSPAWIASKHQCECEAGPLLANRTLATVTCRRFAEWRLVEYLLIPSFAIT